MNLEFAVGEIGVQLVENHVGTMCFFSTKLAKVPVAPAPAGLGAGATALTNCH
jgi:hypothetical protein